MAHAFATLNDDQELLDEIFATLSRSVNPLANPSGSDGTYAAAIGPLPKGLRAMAATHHLDISPTLDGIGALSELRRAESGPNDRIGSSMPDSIPRMCSGVELQASNCWMKYSMYPFKSRMPN